MKSTVVLKIFGWLLILLAIKFRSLRLVYASFGFDVVCYSFLAVKVFQKMRGANYGS